MEEENAKEAARRLETPTTEEATKGAMEAIIARIEVFTFFSGCSSLRPIRPFVFVDHSCH